MLCDSNGDSAVKPFIVRQENSRAATIYMVMAVSAADAMQKFINSYYEKIFTLELVAAYPRYVTVDDTDTMHIFNVHLPAPHQYPTRYSVLECYPTSSRAVWIIDP